MVDVPLSRKITLSSSVSILSFALIYIPHLFFKRKVQGVYSLGNDRLILYRTMNGWGKSTFMVPLLSVQMSHTLPLSKDGKKVNIEMKVHGLNRVFLLDGDGYFPNAPKWNYLFFASKL